MGKPAIHNCSQLVVLLLIVAMTVLQQGCLAAAWIAAVGADSMRTGDVRFQPFEESWVITENAATIVDRPSLTSLALVPVDGDEAMGVRLTKVLLHETALRVVTPTRQHGPLLVTMAPRERAVLARQLSMNLR